MDGVADVEVNATRTAGAQGWLQHPLEHRGPISDPFDPHQPGLRTVLVCPGIIKTQTPLAKEAWLPVLPVLGKGRTFPVLVNLQKRPSTPPPLTYSETS